jgi:hypothetical protein
MMWMDNNEIGIDFSQALAKKIRHTAHEGLGYEKWKCDLP